MPVHVQEHHADPVGFGEIILEGLELVFTDKLQPLLNGSCFLFHGKPRFVTRAPVPHTHGAYMESYISL